MNLDQLRNEVWTAAYNAEFFVLQRYGWVGINWVCKVGLTVGTVVGVIPLLKGFESCQWLSWLSVTAGVIGVAGLPHLGLERCIEITNGRVSFWVDFRDDILQLYRASEASGNVPVSKASALMKRSSETEKDSKMVIHIPWLESKSLKATRATFALWGI